jgi:periplasmic protein TonB
MRTEKPKYPDLNDLAFSGRNKDYGSYLLRKKYPRFLLVSLLLSIVIILLSTLVPLGIYFFYGKDVSFTTEELVTVEYTFIPSPEDDLSALAKAVAKPPEPRVEEVPQIVDTVVPEKKIEPVEEKKVEDENVKTDSAGSANGEVADGTGSSDATGIYTTLDVYPKFPGGPQALLFFLRSNIRYPSASLKSGIQGEVMVLFIVEADGAITNVSVSKGISKECDEEAMRVFKRMPKWDPGRRNGKSVRVLVRMPVLFKNPGTK